MLVGAAGVMYVEFKININHRATESQFRGATLAASTGVLGPTRGTTRCWRTFGRAFHQRDCMTDIGSFRAVPVNLS